MGFQALCGNTAVTQLGSGVILKLRRFTCSALVCGRDRGLTNALGIRVCTQVSTEVCTVFFEACQKECYCEVLF